MSDNPRGRSAVTLKDIADAVGVSITAVSLVCNKPGETNRVSEATAARIREKAKELGYRPNGAAQRLAMRETKLIGVVTDTLGSYVGLRRLDQTARCLLKRGY